MDQFKIGRISEFSQLKKASEFQSKNAKDCEFHFDLKPARFPSGKFQS